jgi:hypothetical protein
MAVDLWVDVPGSLELTMQGGARDETLARDGRTYRLPAGQRTTIRVPIRAAQETVGFATSWKRSAGSPEIADAVFVSDAGRAQLL